jgi:HEAT repeat protein
MRALNANDDGLRISAANALATIGEPAAVPALLETASDDPASGVRATAIDALATLGSPRGVEMLASLAVDPLPLIATSDRWFSPSLTFGSQRNELRQTRRWALKRLQELHAVGALPALENAPRPRSPLLRLRLRRTVRALRSHTP